MASIPFPFPLCEEVDKKPMKYKRQGGHKSQIQPVVQVRAWRALHTYCSIGVVTSWASLKQELQFFTELL